MKNMLNILINDYLLLYSTYQYIKFIYNCKKLKNED